MKTGNTQAGQALANEYGTVSHELRNAAFVTSDEAGIPREQHRGQQ